jgi:2-oxoglutarate/2-oxoacid ferredoxin oxidoreductase subunit alpha
MENREEAIIEIVSDSGEGAQSAGQIFGTLCAKMGNGVWTVEIIPAEIEPPYRSRSGASGNRIRMGTNHISNMGDTADVVMAFNEQVLYSRIDVGAFRPGTKIYLENKWAHDADKLVRQAYAEALVDFADRGFDLVEVSMEEECLKFVSDPRRGKNIWILGVLCAIYQRDLDIAREEISRKFKRKGQPVIDSNLALLQGGFDWGTAKAHPKYQVAPQAVERKMVVMNGNQAIAMGAMAAGMELCSMYPITPATSASHYLAASFKKVGGFVHQAEDEIAAIGFALGASYSGKTALTITSGPGLALKTEFIGLAVMSEIPLVIVDVQRGGPSTGLPTRVEQSDLLATLHASPGDAPKIILAPATIEECFQFMITARTLAEAFRMPVIVLTDANLATGVQPFPCPEICPEQLSPPINQFPWDPEVKPYDWDGETGLSARPIPGQKDGNYVLTGLSHDEESHIAYTSEVNQRSAEARSSKLAVFQQTLNPPQLQGPETGELLVVSWGSTLGTVTEAVANLRQEGQSISSLHLRFLSPLEPGLKQIFQRFQRVMTIEINYSDPPANNGTQASRRYSQLASLLRSHTLVDVDCRSRVPGIPLTPNTVLEMILDKLHMDSEVAHE